MAESQLSANLNLGAFKLFLISKEIPSTNLDIKLVKNTWIKRMPSKEIVQFFREYLDKELDVVENGGGIERWKSAEELHWAWRRQNLAPNQQYLSNDAKNVHVNAKGEQEIPDLQQLVKGRRTGREREDGWEGVKLGGQVLLF